METPTRTSGARRVSSIRRETYSSTAGSTCTVEASWVMSLTACREMRGVSCLERSRRAEPWRICTLEAWSG